MIDVAFVVSGFRAGSAHVQPWRFVGALATGLASRGHRVCLYTDVPDSERPDLGAVTVITNWDVPRLGSGGRRPPSLGPQPRAIVWIVGRLAPLYPSHRNDSDIDVALLTAPLYRLRELLRNGLVLARHPRAYAIHVIGALIPLAIFASFLRSRYAVVVVTANYARNRLVRAGMDPQDVITIAPSPFPSRSRGLPRGSDRVITYAGNASYVRGADLVVRAFAALARRDSSLRLRLLIRRENLDVEREAGHLEDLCERLGVGTKTEMYGNLDPAAVERLLASSAVVALPFRLVPSEAPLLPAEVTRLGVPLVMSDLPPLREFDAPSVVYVRPGNVGSLKDGLAIALRGEIPGTAARVEPTSEGLNAREPVTQLAAILESRQRTAPHAVSTSNPRMVYLCGNDGTGKTTQARLLVEHFRSIGTPCDYVWLRFPQLISLPVLALSRALGITQYEGSGSRRRGRWEFHRARWLANALLWTQVVDVWLYRSIVIDRRTRAGRLVVVDRFAYDILVDIAVAARDQQLLRGAGARVMTRLVRNSQTLWLDANPDRLRVRRRELESDPLLIDRSQAFRELSTRADLHRINADGEISEVQQSIRAALGLEKC